MKLITLDSSDQLADSMNKSKADTEDKIEETSKLYDQLNLSAIVEVLNQLLHHNSVQTKVAVLRWILHLYNKVPIKVVLID